MELIIIEPERLQKLITEAVQVAVKTLSQTTKEPQDTLYSIKELADYLGCSTVKAQQLKNSGKIRYYQTGRKVIFKSEEILEDLKNSKK